MEKISKIVEVIKEYNPKSIYLFGSRARGDNLKTSDIDIAVDLKLDFREKRKLKEKIDKVAGLYSVDLVFFDEMSEKFKEKVIKEGKKL
ncbi:type VII toxin-antitoxin system MntA family adenylyltransferase antitoxin [Caminibacter pacificus]|uniref:Nucleotidyltransferase n=1 Tax=Caminibacter pacificus TaxID=1424653 RepID=A0AAJ4UY13_9BACT|nr:nucleotidyltransferase domain-containing protein [Caminibacter pacificus]QCI27601.1 nucleotidyltransferase domain-containing protein [Caminibacter pacificus]ROR40220.1 putative nucleotidyltransferase [Caminibacter pacificus]